MGLISCLRNVWMSSCFICDAADRLWSCSICLLVWMYVYSLLACAVWVRRIQIQLLPSPSCTLICASHSWRRGRIRGGGRGREHFSTSPERGERQLSLPKAFSFSTPALFTPPWHCYKTLPASKHGNTPHTRTHSSLVRCQWLWLRVLTWLRDFRSPSLAWNSHWPHLPTNSETHMYMGTCVYSKGTYSHTANHTGSLRVRTKNISFTSCWHMDPSIFEEQGLRKLHSFLI